MGRRPCSARSVWACHLSLDQIGSVFNPWSSLTRGETLGETENQNRWDLVGSTWKKWYWVYSLWFHWFRKKKGIFSLHLLNIAKKKWSFAQLGVRRLTVVRGRADTEDWHKVQTTTKFPSKIMRWIAFEPVLNQKWCLRSEMPICPYRAYSSFQRSGNQLWNLQHQQPPSGDFPWLWNKALNCVHSDWWFPVSFHVFLQ